MGDPFVGEIRMLGYGFAMEDWALCQGQPLPVNQNQALYSLIGNVFGGDNTTFYLPDLRGRAPVGPSYSYENIEQGTRAGLEWVTLSLPEMGGHSHTFKASSQPADRSKAGSGNEMFAEAELNLYNSPTNLKSLNPVAVDSIGGGGSHFNLQPSLVVNFSISLMGLYPSRQ